MSGAQLFLGGRVALYAGDCRDVIRTLADGSIDSVVTDPPYALVSIGKRFGKEGAAPSKPGKSGAYARASAGFMGKAWDTGETAFAEEFWAEVLRVLKPGGHVVAFGGTRSYHRLACAIEDAGFEIRDQLAWVYGSGFPKSHDVAKGIYKAAGAERRVIAEGKAVKRMITGADQHRDGWEKTGERVFVPTKTEASTAEAAAWEGWGTALKPAWEPIVLARKPLAGTVAETVLAHGCGALNIAGCRVGGVSTTRVKAGGPNDFPHEDDAWQPRSVVVGSDLGRWPANILHDGSDEVLAAFPETKSGELLPHHRKSGGGLGGSDTFAIRDRTGETASVFGDSGSAARFFYSAKADAHDRIGSKHPTVKPVDLMQWLCRLVTPPGGVILDPFAGSGTTGEAAWREGFSAVLIEREADYQADIARRMALAEAGPATRKAESAKARGRAAPAGGTLFDTAEAAE